MNLAITMAQKDYDISELAAVKRELEGINYLLECEEEGTPESIYDNLPYARKKLVTPFIKSFDYREAQWMNQDYEPLTGYELTTEYYTQRGERVRSKSEILIANQLNKYEIAYKYECPLQIDYGKTIYPDFTCMSKKTGTIMYWEHLGMMDNPEYCEYNLGKITQYENVGIFPGINLILTHETSLHPISTRIIDKIIAAYLY